MISLWLQLTLNLGGTQMNRAITAGLQLTGAMTVTAMLSSCGPTSEASILKQSWKDRYGPSPVMSASAASKSASDQVAIVSAFQRVSASSVDYFSATLAGYNFVDEQCDSYMRALFVLDKDRELTRSGIDAVGQVTNAILGVTSASKLTMGVVTQAFGLGGQFSDDLFKGYLYGASPATIAHVVDAMRTKYRNDTGSARKAINSGGTPVAYAYIRGYLRLCMPSTISASIDNTLSASKVTTDTSGAPDSGQEDETQRDKTTTTPQNRLTTE